MPPVSHTEQRRFAIGRIPQADYVTPVPVANFVEFVTTDTNSTDYQVNTKNNRDHSTGRGQATDQWIESHDTNRSIDFQCSSQQIGRVLLLAFGSVITTTVIPGVFKHVFKPMDLFVQRQLPATSLVEQIGIAINRLFPSMVAESFMLKGNEIERIMGSLGLRGSGLYKSPSLVTIEDLVGLYFFTNSQIKMTLDDGTTLTDVGDDLSLNTWEFGLANALIQADGYRPGARRYQDPDDEDSGAIRSECLLDKVDFNGKFNFRAYDESHFDAIRKQKYFEWVLDLLGAKIGATIHNHQLTVKCDRIAYKTVSVAPRNNIHSLDVTPVFLHDTEAESIVEVTLINDVPSYTI